MKYVFLGLNYVAIPLLKVIVHWGIKKLQGAKNGIPKELAITVLTAVANSEDNLATHGMLSPVMEALDAHQSM